MKRRSISIAVAAVAIAAIGWPAAALSSAQHAKQVRLRAANSQTFTDPTGDSGNAPDVTTVTMSNDDKGQITAAITLANRPALSDSDLGIVQIDTNGNFADGFGGADYVVGFANGSTVLFNAAGGVLSPISPASFSGSFANGVQTFSVNKADIGNPTQINLVIATSGDSATTVAERAPDSNVWNYQITITTGGPSGPTGPGGPLPVVLAATAPHLSKAVAGKPFTASTVVTNSSTGESVQGTVTCSAKLGSSALKATRHTSSADGTATCAWKLPKTAHGKQLKGKIIESYKGKKISKSFSTKVK